MTLSELYRPEFHFTPARMWMNDPNGLVYYYGVQSQTLFVERSVCGQPVFSPVFVGVHAAALKPRNGVIRFHLFVDRASVEVFGNDGETVITDQIFPCPGEHRLELFAEGGPARLTTLKVYELRPAGFKL